MKCPNRPCHVSPFTKGRASNSSSYSSEEDIGGSCLENDWNNLVRRVVGKYFNAIRFSCCVPIKEKRDNIPTIQEVGFKTSKPTGPAFGVGLTNATNFSLECQLRYLPRGRLEQHQSSSMMKTRQTISDQPLNRGSNGSLQIHKCSDSE